MEVGRILRLQGAVRAAAATEVKTAPSAVSVRESYHRLRKEARDAIPEEDVEECDRMFPEDVPAFNVPGNSDAVGLMAMFDAARGLLSQMAEWLGGYVQQARMEANSDAYAKAKLEEERKRGYS